MNCTEIKLLLDVYLDSELDARSSLAVQRHLARCPDCATTFRAAAAAQQRLTRALQKGRRTSSLWTELEQKLIHIDDRNDDLDFQEAERGWRFWLWPGPRWYVALAMVWLIMLAGEMVVSDHGSDGRRVTVGVAAPTQRAMEEQRRLLTELLGERSLSAADEVKSRAPLQENRRTPEVSSGSGWRILPFESKATSLGFGHVGGMLSPPHPAPLPILQTVSLNQA